MKVVLVLSFEAILSGALIRFVFACPLCRRSRFWLRFVGVLIAIVLPGLVAIVAPLGEQARGMLFWLGLVWGSVLIARPESDPDGHHAAWTGVGSVHDARSRGQQQLRPRSIQ